MRSFSPRAASYSVFLLSHPGFGLTESVSILFYKGNDTAYNIYSVASSLGAVFGALSGYWLVRCIHLSRSNTEDAELLF